MIDIAILGGLGLLCVVAFVLIAMSRRSQPRRAGRRRQGVTAFVPADGQYVGR
jgi:hypothetical protein